MIENAEGYDALPEGRKQVIADIRAAVEISSLAENNLVPDMVLMFTNDLKKRFPEVRFSDIPEYQALVGGSEEPGEGNDREIEREVVDEIILFSEQLRVQKKKLRPIS